MMYIVKGIKSWLIETASFLFVPVMALITCRWQSPDNTQKRDPRHCGNSGRLQRKAGGLSPVDAHRRGCPRRGGSPCRAGRM